MVRNEGISHTEFGRMMKLVSLGSTANQPNQKHVHKQLDQMSAVGMAVNQHLADLKMVEGKKRYLAFLFS